VTDNIYRDWIETLDRRASLHSLLFVQLGAAQEPARRALEASEFAIMRLGDVTAGLASTRRVIVVDGIEALASARPNSGLTMGVLRDRVFAYLENGTKIILLSRAPRVAFPPVPGSSLLDDSSYVHGPRDLMAEVNHWPSCKVDGQEPAFVLRAALRELGPEVCASLDRAIFDCLLTGEEAIRVLSAREVEAIEAAGLVSLSSSATRWNFPKHLNPLKEALADVLAGEVTPQAQLAEVSSGLWQMERMIRRAIRQRAVDAWSGNWRQQCLTGDLPAKVLERATEAAYPAANSIKLIRDPLEWLTLGELLDLKNRGEIGDLGMPNSLWRNFSSDIMPIRNRLAHMRTLHPGDSADVVKWLRALEVKLPR
jgi:hypothetical protein